LFGVLCLQADLIDENRFAEACTLWAARKTVPLADLLQERGWIGTAERGHIDFLLARKLDKHDGDARRSLADAAGPAVRDILRSLDDPDARQTLAQLPPASGYVLISTTGAPLEQRLRYTLTRLHGEGGLGRVYVAHDNDLNRDVALKEIRPDKAQHPEAWQRFLKEAQLTGQLEHPNIVPVYEVARREADQAPFYTMRLVRGQTLREAIADYHQRRRDGRASPLERMRLLGAFVSVCHAIGYAHSRGVIHRDLKPENIMLGGFGEVIVLDWGLAKLVDQPDDGSDTPAAAVTEQARTDATVAGRVLGTPAYSSPEQAEGRVDLIDTRTDIYGLGAILFELLTGRPPHQGESTAALLRHVALAETPRARAIEPSVPPPLDAICARAMARARTDRYARAADLAHEVQRFQADEPVEAYREPPLKRAGRWARHHRPLVAAAGVLLAASVLFLTVLLFLIEGARERAVAERARTESERQRADHNFRRARAAVDDYFTAVSQNRLLGEPGMEPLRKELLEKARKYYEEFAREAEGDARVRGDLAAAHFRVARITDLIGSPEAAWTGYRQAAALFEEVLPQDPDNADWRHSLGLCCNHWGRSQQEHGSMEEALRLFRKARTVLEPLTAEAPDSEKCRSTLAGVYFNTALWNNRAGRVEGAARFLEMARKLQEKIVADNPRAAEHESDLALTLMNMGNLHLENGRPEQAQPLFEKTLAIESRLVLSDPRSLFHQQTLGTVRHNLGMLHRLMCRMDQAVKEYDEARTIRSRLVDSHPDVTSYQHDLGETLNNIGEIQLFLRQEDASRLTWQQTETLFRKLARENPNSARSRNHLGLAHNNLGVVLHQLGKAAESLDHEDQAVKLREGLVRDNPLVLDYHCFVADSTNNRGNALRLLGRTEEALAAYQKSAALYDPLIRDHPTLTRYRINQGIVLGNIGYLQEEAERFEEALAAYEKSRAVRASLVGINPRVPRFHADLALTDFCIARVQTRLNVLRYPGPIGAAATCGPASPLNYLPFLFVRPEEVQSCFSETALANYNRSLKARLQLVADHPTIPDYQADLGRTYIELGNVARDNKDLVGAFGHYRKGIDVLKKLVADRPKVAEFRHNLAIGHSNYGLTMQDLRLALLALNAHEEGRKLREVLIAERPDDKEYPRDLASTYNGLGLANLSLRRYDQALAWFDKAEAAWLPVIARQPDSALHRSNRARAVLNRGITLAEMKRPEMALVEYRRALALNQDALDRRPGHFKYRELVGKTHQKMAAACRALGRTEAAACAIRKWRCLWTVHSDPLADVAADLLLCAPLAGNDRTRQADAEREAQRYQDEAMEILQQAVARGYRDQRRLANDPAFASLRGRADFQKLLAPDDLVLIAGTGRGRAADQELSLALIDRAIKAHGGPAALARARVMTRKGTGASTTGPKPTSVEEELTVDLPQRYRRASTREVGKQKYSTVRVLNGDKGWNMAGKKPISMSGPLLKNAREDAYGLWLMTLVPLREEPGFALTPLGEDRVGGQPADGVLVHRQGHEDRCLYFDRTTGLLVKVQRRDWQAGRVQVRETVFSGYKDFEGLKLPTRAEEWLNGKSVETASFSYQLGQKVDERLFTMP
jgi:serine/threonine-protein kinase